VDPLTHGLASLAIQRGFFPRASWRSVTTIILAGVVADLDWFSAAFGPLSYLKWNRTATHSIAFVLVLTLIALVLSRKVRNNTESAGWSGFSWVAIVAAALLHILMDLLQAYSVVPFWPFSGARLWLDIAPAIDPWILTILAAAIYCRTVSSRRRRNRLCAKRPRGRNGAIVGLSLLILYFGLRTLFHGNAIASLESRTVGGEMPRRAAAFPDALSPFLWHSIVETESALNLATMRSMGGDVSYASVLTTLRKPEPSATLNASQASPAAVAFLNIARFPKAVVQKETEGFSVEIQDLKDQALNQKDRTIVADVVIDKGGNVVSSELQWQKNTMHP
jgi:membrane-bound metal-dependent hydrolase YbcI (DUF457 family)